MPLPCPPLSLPHPTSSWTPPAGAGLPPAPAHGSCTTAEPPRGSPAKGACPRTGAWAPGSGARATRTTRWRPAVPAWCTARAPSRAATRTSCRWPRSWRRICDPDPVPAAAPVWIRNSGSRTTAGALGLGELQASAAGALGLGELQASAAGALGLGELQASVAGALGLGELRASAAGALGLGELQASAAGAVGLGELQASAAGALGLGELQASAAGALGLGELQASAAGACARCTDLGGRSAGRGRGGARLLDGLTHGGSGFSRGSGSWILPEPIRNPFHPASVSRFVGYVLSAGIPSRSRRARSQIRIWIHRMQQHSHALAGRGIGGSISQIDCHFFLNAKCRNAAGCQLNVVAWPVLARAALQHGHAPPAVAAAAVATASSCSVAAAARACTCMQCGRMARRQLNPRNGDEIRGPHGNVHTVAATPCRRWRFILVIEIVII